MKVKFWVLEKRSGQVPSSNFNYSWQLCWSLTFVFWGRLVHFHIEGPNFCHLVVLLPSLAHGGVFLVHSSKLVALWHWIFGTFKVIICLRCFTLRSKWLLSGRKEVVVISVMTCEWWVANCSARSKFWSIDLCNMTPWTAPHVRALGVLCVCKLCWLQLFTEILNRKLAPWHNVLLHSTNFGNLFPKYTKLCRSVFNLHRLSQLVREG
jgi:hypothetical protein